MQNRLLVEDHPWGEIVFKFGGKSGKIFAFLGHPEADDVGVTVKELNAANRSRARNPVRGRLPARPFKTLAA